MTPEKTLWLEVLRLALTDFCADRTNQEIPCKHDAARWFESPSRELGSFLFVAQVVDINPDALRKVLLTADKTVLLKRLNRQCAPKDYKRRTSELDNPIFESTPGRRVSGAAIAF